MIPADEVRARVDQRLEASKHLPNEEARKLQVDRYTRLAKHVKTIKDDELMDLASILQEVRALP
jgi:hypothetical protein